MVELDGILDMEVFYNPAYWFLSGGAIFALLLGYKLQSAWGQPMMPLSTLIITLVLVPVAGYFITLVISNR